MPFSINSKQMQSSRYSYLNNRMILITLIVVCFIQLNDALAYSPSSSFLPISSSLSSSSSSSKSITNDQWWGTKKTPSRRTLSLLTRTKYSSTNENNEVRTSDNQQDNILKKDDLLNLLSKVPPNQSTPKQLTNEILESVSNLEKSCPTNTELVLGELNGNWELIWTAQDSSSDEVTKAKKNGIVKIQNWINPLENQSYSNNPFSQQGANDSSTGGRSNPILPQSIQDKLEGMGVLINESDDEEVPSKNKSKDDNSAVRSSQAIDIKKGRVRNVVSVLVKSPLPLPFSNKGNKVRGSLTVDVNFTPNKFDTRKIDVKFNECRITLQNSPLDITIPLGPIGPTGWLRTTYIDETMRITRGHKGSVFILQRTAKRK